MDCSLGTACGLKTFPLLSNAFYSKFPVSNTHVFSALQTLGIHSGAALKICHGWALISHPDMTFRILLARNSNTTKENFGIREMEIIRPHDASGRMTWVSISRVNKSRSSNPFSSQTSDLKMDTYRFLARHWASLGKGRGWLAQCPDNVTEWDIRSSCWRPGLPVGQHYKSMSAHCHKSVPVLMGL